MRLLTYLLLAMTACTASIAQAATSDLVDTGRVEAQLVASHNSVAPGGTFNIALRTIIDPEWHTYWSNPGDSGEPVQITWDVPEGVSYGDITWPLPDTIATGPIINYGFSDVPLFPVEFTVPETYVAGDVLPISANVYYLVCKDICIPEQTDLSLSVRIGEPALDRRWNAAIENAKAKSPKPSSLDAGLIKNGEDLLIQFADIPEGADISEAYFFPWKLGVVDHSSPQIIERGETGFQLRTVPGYDWSDSSVPADTSGVLRFVLDGEPTGIQVAAEPGNVIDIGAVEGGSASAEAASFGILAALIGAFIGGLILNLMPCVFPVISIKALSVAKSSGQDARQVRRDAWLYTAGVLATFLLLTVLLLALRAGGAELGWGFQLQNPVLVGALAILLFVIGLNLLGFFEIGGGFQNTGQGLTQSSSAAATFFTGVLAVVVATPCTAPFMAGAIGYSLAQPALITLIIFAALGLGFALPFLLIAYIPAFRRVLPKPGPWMERFKELLAFPMFGAAIWLVWVLTVQAGDMALIKILVSMLGVAFAIWLFKRRRASMRAAAALALIAALAVPLTLRAAQGPVELDAQVWSPAKVTELRADGQAVFVDFTAAWCVTCKVNERLVLKTDEIKQAFKDTNTAFLVADWTNQDDVIARELERHGRSGVPLYLLYPPAGPGENNNNAVKPEILPQILTKDMVLEQLKGMN